MGNYVSIMNCMGIWNELNDENKQLKQSQVMKMNILKKILNII